MQKRVRLRSGNSVVIIAVKTTESGCTLDVRQGPDTEGEFVQRVQPLLTELASQLRGQTDEQIRARLLSAAAEQGIQGDEIAGGDFSIHVQRDRRTGKIFSTVTPLARL